MKSFWNWCKSFFSTNVMPELKKPENQKVIIDAGKQLIDQVQNKK